MYVWHKSLNVTIVPLHKESGGKISISGIWGQNSGFLVLPD